MKPKVRCCYSGDDSPLGNLGDILTPPLLNSLGYSCAPQQESDENVINPGRCLLAIGSLLTQSFLHTIKYPADIWGCGWKGAGRAPAGPGNSRYFAVRGPQTAAGLSLPPDIPLGDPALLVPHLIPLSYSRHGKAIVIPHLHQLKSMSAAKRCAATGCTETVSTVVWPTSIKQPFQRITVRNAAGILHRRVAYGIRTLRLWSAVRRIAGAGFVLTGSLHGAILAQAYGVPWAAYSDGYVDAPPKWDDWAAYLGVELGFTRTLVEGRNWWLKHGRHGKIRSLRPLLNAFPYPILSPVAQRLAKELP